ncbi:hypothetical protein BaRGS_00011364 [Batillaria attramentaria]|uniref:Uncharacterized protein n=1 Tax=Batillaria attramentaria TaxID=370345 RepID=A0ABD0LDC3_9CAEN
MDERSSTHGPHTTAANFAGFTVCAEEPRPDVAVGFPTSWGVSLPAGPVSERQCVSVTGLVSVYVCQYGRRSFGCDVMRKGLRCGLHGAICFMVLSTLG